MMYRAFLAHKRQLDDRKIDQLVAGATLLLRGKGADFAKVISGRDDFKERSASLGGWQGWARDVATGEDEYGSPSFHAIIIPDERIGKATAGIVQEALNVGKAVYFWRKSELLSVQTVEAVDPKDWKQGWRLIFAQQKD